MAHEDRLEPLGFIINDAGQLVRNREPYPSEQLPESIADQARSDTVIRDYADYLQPKIEALKPAFPEPHAAALGAFIRGFNYTPHERPIHDLYRSFSRPDLIERPIVQQASEREGLPYSEYVARETLKRLQQFCSINGIPIPPVSKSDPSAKGNGVNPAEICPVRAQQSFIATDYERFVFYNELKAAEPKLTYAQAATLWEKSPNGGPCDEGPFKQSVYRVRKASKK